MNFFFNEEGEKREEGRPNGTQRKRDAGNSAVCVFVCVCMCVSVSGNFMFGVSVSK